MKKFFAFVIMITMVMSVMVMGPEKALAKETETEVTATQLSDVDRATRAINGLSWYVEHNPNWDEKVVKVMIHQDNDTDEVVIATTWIDNGEWYSETYRYNHDDIVTLDAYTMCICAAAHVGTWMD